MSTEEANLFYTDDDVRSAYSKLRALTQEEFSADGGYKWVFLLQTQVIEQERGLPPEERQRRADLALAEGLVDVFCRVADWIGLRTVDSLTELKQRAEREKYDAYTMLENIASYRSCHSAKLSAKVSNEELFFKGDVLRLKSMIKNEEFYVVPILIQNMILLCDGAERSIGKYRAHGVYNMVRDIYDTWTDEEVLIRSLMLLSTLANEKEARELLSEAALQRLVTFLGRIVRNELHTDHPFWSLRRRALLLRTLEKLATSNERVGRRLVLLDVLPLLTRVLDALDAKASDLRAALACLWTLSNDTLAVDRIARDRTLLLEIVKFKTSNDNEQRFPAKKIIEAVEALGDIRRNFGRPSTAPSDLSKFPKLPPIVLQGLCIQSTPHRELAVPFGELYSVSKESSRAISDESRDNTKGTGAEQSRSELKAKDKNLDEKSTAKKGEDTEKVFISYQSAFTERAIKIKREVEARGISCWIAAEDMVGDVQDAIAAALKVAPAIIICFSQPYRQSIYCKAEANLAFRSKIPMVPVCVEEGYEADNWLALITAAAHGYDCSTDEMLTSSMDGVVKELLHALRLRKDGKSMQVSRPPAPDEKGVESSTRSEQKTKTRKHAALQPIPAPLSNSQAAVPEEASDPEQNSGGKQTIISEQNVSKKDNKHTRKHKHKDNSTKVDDTNSEPLEEWDTNRTAQWLSSIGLYDSIQEETRVQLDGSSLKELLSMKHNSPSDFEKYIKKIFHFEGMAALKFRAQLEKLE